MQTARDNTLQDNIENSDMSQSIDECNNQQMSDVLLYGLNLICRRDESVNKELQS